MSQDRPSYLDEWTPAATPLGPLTSASSTSPGSTGTIDDEDHADLEILAVDDSGPMMLVVVHTDDGSYRRGRGRPALSTAGRSRRLEIDAFPVQMTMDVGWLLPPKAPGLGLTVHLDAARAHRPPSTQLPAPSRRRLGHQLLSRSADLTCRTPWRPRPRPALTRIEIR